MTQKTIPEKNHIIKCHHFITSNYPELNIRWSVIYGKRWAYLYGNTDNISINAKRIVITPSLGLTIDNYDVLTEDKLEILISKIKECFNDKSQQF